jgi:acyl dehydratase
MHIKGVHDSAQRTDRLPRAIDLTGPPMEREVRRPMHTAEMFARGLRHAAFKDQGRIVESFVPGPMRLRHAGLRLEPSRIEAYRRVCEYEAQPRSVPLLYPELHFTPLMAETVVSSRFPLSPLGLIHIDQSVEQRAALRPGDVVDATSELSALRETDRGYEVEFSLTLERRGMQVWSGVATMLSRSPQARSSRGRGHRPKPRAGKPELSSQTLKLTVPANTGRAFARVSGDWNPHHLWWFTARPLGYRRPIAHGMWTFARALAVALHGVDDETPLHTSASFKRPLLMPGRIDLDAPRLQSETPFVRLGVHDADSGAPHLLGEAGYLDAREGATAPG